jgi:integrase/recombinase XerD
LPHVRRCRVRHLFHLRKPNGKPLSFSSQIARLVPVRGFFKWLTRQNVLLWNPASEIELPRAEKRLPKHVLTADEAEAVMLVPDISDPIGLRDRAILETLYSTGIRRMEVINLTVFDLDPERGTLMVRQGKGKKDRMVPIGERAIAWLARYLNDARPQLVLPPDPGTLFLTQEGEELSTYRLTQLVRDYVQRADMGKSGACHLFRHTCATLRK